MVIAQLKEVKEGVSRHMNAILSLFEPGVKISVLIRMPGDGDMDFCLTNDKLEDVKLMIERRIEECSGVELRKDPTYNRSEIDANPVWKLAFKMSEMKNDQAPLGWGQYIEAAQAQLEEQ